MLFLLQDGSLPGVGGGALFPGRSGFGAGRPAFAIIREALWRSCEELPGQRLPSFVGIGEGGRTGVSGRGEGLLAGRFQHPSEGFVATGVLYAMRMREVKGAVLTEADRLGVEVESGPAAGGPDASGRTSRSAATPGGGGEDHRRLTGGAIAAIAPSAPPAGPPGRAGAGCAPR